MTGPLDDTVATLRIAPAFRTLPVERLKLIGFLATGALLPPGQVMLRAGTASDSLGIVLSGELSVLTGLPEPFDVTTRGQTRIARLSKAQFEDLLDSIPGLESALLRDFARRLQAVPHDV